jgi:hypothetical protein
MSDNNLTVRKGEQYNIHCTIRDKTEALVDLTGASVWFTVKERRTDADPGVLQLTVGSGITLANQVTNKGELDIKILTTHFASVVLDKEYTYDVKVKLSSLDEFIAVDARFTLKQAVTAST